MYRLFLALLPLACLAGDFDRTVQPFLARNCETCHNAKLKTANLDLAAYTSADDVLRNRETWELVLKRLRAGEMPPKGLPRPDAAQLASVTHWIEGQFDLADKQSKPEPGHVTARRLNRAEYNNTIHDLLDVNLRPADDFPQDDAGYGFDNIGDVLSVSPVLMEKYLAAAEAVAHEALFGPKPRKPAVVRLQPPPRPSKPHTEPPADYDLTGLDLPNSLHATYQFPVDGEYELRTSLVGFRPAGSSPIDVAFWIDGKQVSSAKIDPDVNGPSSAGIPIQDFYGQERGCRTRISAGDHWLAVSIPRLYEGLPESFHGPNPSRRPVPPPIDFAEYLRRVRPNASPAEAQRLRKAFDVAQSRRATLDYFRVDYLDVVGPYNVPAKPSPESLRRIYACGHLDGRHQPGCARIIVGKLARRAFRRPVTPQEIAKYSRLVSMAQQQGDSFADGVALALEAMLVSPHFLFRIENDPKPGPISQYELASRLSYFLWSSMPDDELLRRAESGTLRKPEVLSAEVRRMLRDRRSDRLVENFGGQWLEFRALESAAPDRERFPEFDEYLRLSMKRETEMFLASILREDHGIFDLIDAKYTFLNERLAELYGIPGVKGPEFRRVDLTGNPQRGGILTQASVLSVSSYATRTSPVLRGKWILDNVLNDPPPPPPPDVPNLDVTNVGKSVSLRQQLEAHRNNALCASCHSKMDPLGFGLANYNAIGAWQTRDGELDIDASGTLPDGRKFAGPEGLKKILDGDSEVFARAVAEKMLTYALGRGLEPFDQPAIRQIVRETAAGGYRATALVLAIVNSVPFQMQAEPKSAMEAGNRDHHP